MNREIVGARVGASVEEVAKRSLLRNPEPVKLCQNCSKHVPPNRTIDGRPARSITMLVNDPNRLFCTMRCAVVFAVAMWNKYKAPR